MSKKFLLALAPALAAAAVALGVVASSASAVVCNAFVLCPGGAAEKLRDDFTEPPEGVSGGSFGTSALAVNTVGPLRLTEPTAAVFNENPKGDAFFGIKIHSDPATVPANANCKEGLGEAEGWVLFVDIQNAKNTSGESSPVYDDTSPGDNGPWPIGIRSNHCSAATHPGRVVIERVALYFPNLIPGGATITGALTGLWAPQETGKCENASGGVELNEEQTVTINGVGGKKVKINGGAAGKAFICFVSANNYLFPNTPPVWTPFTGSINKD